jgi:hypothetical protein
MLSRRWLKAQGKGLQGGRSPCRRGHRSSCSGMGFLACKDEAKRLKNGHIDQIRDYYLPFL